jgi:hypothetical protein
MVTSRRRLFCLVASFMIVEVSADAVLHMNIENSSFSINTSIVILYYMLVEKVFKDVSAEVVEASALQPWRK